MATTLYLVRHGETIGSEVRRYKGHVDVPLSEEGIAQMKRTSVLIRNHLCNLASSLAPSYLKDVFLTDPGADTTGSSTLTAVYCSNLSRSIKSAEIIAESFGLIPVPIPDLKERHFGIWEGMAITEIKEKYPAEFEQWAHNPLEYYPPQGESTQAVKERVVAVLNRVLGNHKDEPFLIVAHGGVNRVLLCHIMGVPLENVFRIEQDTACVNIIEFWKRYPVVKAFNVTPSYFGCE